MHWVEGRMRKNAGNEHKSANRECEKEDRNCEDSEEKTGNQNGEERLVKLNED
jgi:hypothetical protein